MKVWKRALTGLLAGLLLLGSACSTTAPPVEEIPPVEPPVVEENIVPDAGEPGLPDTRPLEQAGLVDSDLMLHRLEDNLLEPVAAAVRLSQKDNSTLTQLTPALLHEVAGFLCQNYTVLRQPVRVDLRGAIYMQIFGEKENHDVYIQQWIDGEGREHSFVQVEEDGVMGQYIYDPSTYHALREVLSGWQYDNRVTLRGNYQLLSPGQYQEDLLSGHFEIRNLTQFGDLLMFQLQSLSNSSNSRFEIINTRSGNLVQTIPMNKPILDVRRTDLEGYDFYLITEDTVHTRSSSNPALQQDFTIPESVKEKLLDLEGYPLFDLDTINDELVYISKDGVVLSNQTGRRNDLLLRHEALYELLGLDREENDASHEELTPLYVSPQLLNGGKLIVCPILLQNKDSARWVGFSIFNLMNGTSKDYVNEFSRISSFDYPDDTSLIVYGEKSIFRMDLLTREISSRDWSCQVSESPYFQRADSMILWQRSMDYQQQLLLQPLGGEEAATPLLTMEGDRVHVYDTTENYVLLSWSDKEGSFMAVVKHSAP